MKIRLILTVVLLFIGSAAVAGAWQVTKVGGVVTALIVLVLLATIWGVWRLLGKKKKTAKTETPAPISAPEPKFTVTWTPPTPKEKQEPREPEFPFSSCQTRTALKLKDYVVFDTETTGLSAKAEKIVELAGVKVKDGQETRFHSLINPERHIPGRASSVHGIKDEDVAGAPTFAQLLPDLEFFLEDLPIVGHNINFDLRFLGYEYMAAGKEIPKKRYVDTVSLARRAFPDMPDYKLATLIKEFGLIEGEQEHRAGSDVDATLALFRRCCEELTKDK